MNSSTRRLRLILMLQNRKRRLTVKDLAEEFQISERTVYRDMQALSDMNVPVKWDPYKGYSIMEGYSTPPLTFDDRELATILIGLSFVNSQVDQTMVDDANGIKLKIYEILPDNLKNIFESLQQRTIVDPYKTLGKEKKKGGNWYHISTAIANRQSIEISYLTKYDSSLTKRKVDPYLLVYFTDHWNVIGYCHIRKAPRNFILDRIEDIQWTGEQFVVDASYSTEDLIYGIDEYEESETVELDVNNNIFQTFKERIPAQFEVVSSGEGTTTVRFEFDNLDYINKWLLQFHQDIRVKRPESLISKRRQLLSSMLQNTE